MKKILFMIPSLGQGGAEKVLVNLVNNMDKKNFDITVMTLFDGGVNKPFLLPHIHYKSVFKKAFPCNCKILSLFAPYRLHKKFVKEQYDIEVSYLEGPTARIIAGAKKAAEKRGFPAPKIVSWIHVEQHTLKAASYAFRSEKEARKLYSVFDKTIAVSKTVAEDFQNIYQFENAPEVLYNTVESEVILEKSKQEVQNVVFSSEEINLISVGSLKAMKGFDRLINVTKKLRENGLPIHTYILGKGDDLATLQGQAQSLGIADKVTFLGYDTNPYKYVAKCDLFVCSSHREGFSTAVTESLIVGTPVCTTLVSGMKEMLGENEYGFITENNEESLYQGVYTMLTKEGLLQQYKEKARERGRAFSTEQTTNAVEDMFLDL